MNKQSNKAIDYDPVVSLHCDNEPCGKDTAIPEGKTLADCIGMPCPHCGSNLLTQEDHDHIQNLFKTIDQLNETLPPREEGEEEVHMTYHHHAGETTIEIKTPGSQTK